MEIDKLYGIYFRGEYPVSETFKIFAVLGFTQGELTASALGIELSEDESDLSYGFGAEIVLNEKVGINLQYMQYLDKSDFDISGFGIGIKLYF